MKSFWQSMLVAGLLCIFGPASHAQDEWAAEQGRKSQIESLRLQANSLDPQLRGSLDQAIHNIESQRINPSFSEANFTERTRLDGEMKAAQVLFNALQNEQLEQEEQQRPSAQVQTQKLQPLPLFIPPPMPSADQIRRAHLAKASLPPQAVQNWLQFVADMGFSGSVGKSSFSFEPFDPNDPFITDPMMAEALHIRALNKIPMSYQNDHRWVHEVKRFNMQGKELRRKLVKEAGDIPIAYYLYLTEIRRKSAVIDLGAGAN